MNRVLIGWNLKLNLLKFVSIKLNSVLHCYYSFDRDKKKVYAPNHPAFYPFGVDVFLSPRKIDHIARFVELPTINSSGEVPAILVVNLQVIHFHYSLTMFSTACLNQTCECLNIRLYKYYSLRNFIRTTICRMGIGNIFQYNLAAYKADLHI